MIEFYNFHKVLIIKKAPSSDGAFSNLLPMKLDSSFGVTGGCSLLHPQSAEPMQFIQR